MADETKVDAETTLKEAAETTPKTPKNEGEHIDYKTLHEEEKARRIKAEATIQRNKAKPREEVQSESFVEPDLIRSVVREEIEELKSSLSSQFRAKEISDAILKVAPDSHEASLIRYHYDNSIRQSGDLELDVENARALANKKRAQSQVEELKASIESRETRSSGSTTGRKPNVEGQSDDSLPFLTNVDRQSIDFLQQKYVLSNSAIRRILNGEKLDDLLAQGVIKKR